MIKTKSQKRLGVNSYVCKSFRRKLMVPVQNREQMKSHIISLCKIKGNGGSDKKITASIITHLLPVEIKQKNMDLVPFISTFNNLKNITLSLFNYFVYCKKASKEVWTLCFLSCEKSHVTLQVNKWHKGSKQNTVTNTVTNAAFWDKLWNRYSKSSRDCVSFLNCTLPVFLTN